MFVKFEKSAQETESIIGIDKMIVYSLGGPQPYIPVGLDDKVDVAETVVRHNPQKRARVLCSYDAADATELNLTGNEVSKKKNSEILNCGNFSLENEELKQ